MRDFMDSQVRGRPGVAGWVCGGVRGRGADEVAFLGGGVGAEDWGAGGAGVVG